MISLPHFTTAPSNNLAGRYQAHCKTLVGDTHCLAYGQHCVSGSFCSLYILLGVYDTVRTPLVGGNITRTHTRESCTKSPELKIHRADSDSTPSGGENTLSPPVHPNGNLSHWRKCMFCPPVVDGLHPPPLGIIFQKKVQY